MSTGLAVKFITNKNKLFASGFTRNIKIQYVPLSIQMLFIIYYIEYDHFHPNPAYKLYNLNTKIKHLLRMKYSYIYGNVIMNGLQTENIIYQWNLQIHYSQNASLTFGIINNKHRETQNIYDDVHYAYRGMAPFDVHYKGYTVSPENQWLSLEAHRKLPWIRNNDIMTVSVKFTKGKCGIITFYQNKKPIMSYDGIDSNYKYKLFVCMGKSSQYDKLSILNFKTISFK